MAALGLPCNAQAPHCGDFSRCGAGALGACTFVVVVYRSSCPTACGIFYNQGSNPRPLYRQVDS